MHSLEFTNLGDTILFNGEFYNNNTLSNNYYFYGRHSIFISNKEWDVGYKFFVVKNQAIDESKIKQIYNIHKLLYSGNWAVDVISFEECYYNGVLIVGLKIEKAWHSASGKMPFILSEFRSFCEKINGLDKNDNVFKYRFGTNWRLTHPECKFFVGENNLLETKTGKLVLVDIDPRWSLSS